MWSRDGRGWLWDGPGEWREGGRDGGSEGEAAVVEGGGIYYLLMHYCVRLVEANLKVLFFYSLQLYELFYSYLSNWLSVYLLM